VNCITTTILFLLLFFTIYLIYDIGLIVIRFVDNATHQFSLFLYVNTKTQQYCSYYAIHHKSKNFFDEKMLEIVVFNSKIHILGLRV
jgi:Na+-transporting methylmalonyl-CoA/oxaloacetate decarboxylase gamma subunit